MIESHIGSEVLHGEADMSGLMRSCIASCLSIVPIARMHAN